jgi:hypothetical protein
MTKKTIAVPATQVSAIIAEMPLAERLTVAVGLLANAFDAPTKRIDRETGQETTINTMAFPQERVLNGIAYQVHTTLKMTRDNLDKAREQAQEAVRNHRGDEISENRLAGRLDWIERLEDQESTLMALEMVMTTAFARYVGKPFTPPVMTPRPRPEFQSAALQRAQRHLGMAGEAQQTDGVIRPARNAA